MSDNFFITPQAEDHAILLIDASGSVLQNFPEDGAPAKTVFDKMQQICLALPHKEFRLLFWNSNTNKTKFDASGVLQIPFAVAKDKLPLNFKIARDQIDNTCLTMPHLAFANVGNWLQSNYSRSIYFVTDGLIGWDSASVFEKRQLGALLANEINAIVAKYRDVQLSILAVERNSQTDYSAIESMAKVVGNDVFEAISNNRLTTMVARFRSFTPRHADGYDHIDRGTQTPNGFVPFGRRGYFSPLSTPQFMTFIANEIATNRQSEDALLKIVQDLSPTLNVLTRDKPARTRTQTFDIFCRMFEGTALDASMVQFLLSRAVSAEACGSAQLYAEYRANLKNLYANAGKMLHDNAATSMSIGERSLTLPLQLSNGKLAILVADSRTPDQTVLGHNNGGYLLDGKLVPVVPFISPLAGLMTKQCVRQWMRLLLSTLYHVNSTSDEVMIIMMTINLQTRVALLDDRSPTAAAVCNAYGNLVTVMLEKKRLNSQTTEIDQLLAGNLFVPNDGNLASFTRFLQNAAARIGVAAMEPLKVWYYLCLAHSQQLANSQFAHCQQHVKADATLADSKDWSLPAPSVVLHHLPDELEYVCLITMESTRDVGGFKFVAHKDAMGSDCFPRQVLSAKGVDQLLAKPETSLCPICYTSLTRANFAEQAASTPVSPASSSLIFNGSLLETDAFRNSSGTVGGGSANGKSSQSSSSSSSASVVPAAPSGPPIKKTTGILVVLCGTVGCGKTTFATELQRLEQANGKYCLVTGSDKFVAQSVPMGPAAAARVKQELIEAQQSAESDKVVVLDTCGENFQKNNVFGVDFSAWRIERVWVNLDRKQLSRYLAWSLRNVIQRKPDESVLNPHKAGLGVCIKVHLKKARAHFGKKTPELVPESISMDALLQRLAPEADEYQRYLEANKDEYAPKPF